MAKILLTGARGNFGRRCASTLLELCPHEDLVFASSAPDALADYAAAGVETRAANFNEPAHLAESFAGIQTLVLISVPFVGPRRQAAHKAAVDAAVAVGVRKIVYTSAAGAGSEGIDTYELNDHIWTENYIREQPLHYLFLRNSQYAEAMVASFMHAYENEGGVLSNNMGEGRMAFISRDDCACAAAYAALSDWQDRVIDVNGAELLTIGEFLQIGSEVTGKQVTYRFVDDETQYELFDALGVPRTTEEMWADTAAAFPYCSDGMVSFGRAIRQGQMSVFTDDFEKLTGRCPLTVRQIFEDMEHHGIGQRTVTD